MSELMPNSSSAEFEEPIRNVELSLDNGPIDIRLAGQPLRIVDPLRDLDATKRDGLNHHIGCFIIDPATLNPRANKGFKALRDGELVTLGRAYTHDRFDFVDEVSRRHISIERRGDRVQFIDLDSTNGSELIHRADGPSTAGEIIEYETTPPLSQGKEKAAQNDSFHLAGASVASERHPDENEDSYFVDPDNRSIGVFDGLGGHAGSAAASSIAAETVVRSLAKVPASTPYSIAELAIREALEQAHTAILEQRQPGIATTAVIAKVFESKSGDPYAIVGSAGDSRAYLIRNYMIEHVTLDHVFSGMSTTQRSNLQETLSQATTLSGLSDEERSMFYQRNVVGSCLGNDPRNHPTISVSNFPLQPGDQILLTSDGVHDNLTNAEIETIVARHQGDVEGVTHGLVQAAQARSRNEDHTRHKPDDMTAAILAYHG